MLRVKCSIISALVGALTIFGHGATWGADWKFYGGNNNGESYYDVQNIIRPSENIVRVWTKTIHTDKGIIGIVGKYGKDWENVKFSICLQEINCSDKKSHFLSQDYYAEEGNVLFSFGPRGEWKFVVPGSMADALYEKVCR